MDLGLGDLALTPTLPRGTLDLFNNNSGNQISITNMSTYQKA